MMSKVKVWDGFIRSFHWLLVLSIALLYFSAEEGMIELHFVAGFFTLALLVTRLIWGIIGSKTAKLTALIHSPQAVIASLKGNQAPLGHSAPGSYMVLLFFILLALQLTTGLMSSDGILTDGPLAQYVSSASIDTANWLHSLNFELLLYAIGLHVLAIVIYKLKGKPLVKAMITGSKQQTGTAPQALTTPPWLAWVIFFIVLVTVMATWGREPLSYLLS